VFKRYLRIRGLSLNLTNRWWDAAMISKMHVIVRGLLRSMKMPTQVDVLRAFLCFQLCKKIWRKESKKVHVDACWRMRRDASQRIRPSFIQTSILNYIQAIKWPLDSNDATMYFWGCSTSLTLWLEGLTAVSTCSLEPVSNASPQESAPSQGSQLQL
jgi:hypothetical protein